MKTVIIGGVAAGASAAARLRRLDESAEIVLLERGQYISFANCGLPYHLGGVIPDRERLLVMKPEQFRAWYRVDVRTESEVRAIYPTSKTFCVRQDGREYTETYDWMVLATGSSPIQTPLPGADDPRVFTLWTISDMDQIMARVTSHARRVVVIGAGFLGLEVAENLRERGLDVTVVDMADQILTTLDREMTTPLVGELVRMGIVLKLGRKVASFESDADESFVAVLDNGEVLEADFVVSCTGVRPNSELAKEAGLELGPRGHIVVDRNLRTSDPFIFAAGDVVEVLDPITQTKTAIPLAGPANRQGRIVADNIVGRNETYSGTLGTSIVKIGQLTAASVGLTERRLKSLPLPYQKIYLHPASGASFYPGASPLHMKLLFAPNDGELYGAQIVGGKGVDKRIDVVATAMEGHWKAPDLAKLELAYAPPYGSAKDPVNYAGMIAGNVLSGMSQIVHAEAIPENALRIDVREKAEFELGTIPGALSFPLGELRERLSELDPTREIVTFCQVGLRGYLAERILRQHGFSVKNLSGGFTQWKFYHPDPFVPPRLEPPVRESSWDREKIADTLDVRALACPGPVVRLKQKMDVSPPGAMLRLLAPTSFEPDLRSWVAASGNLLEHLEIEADLLEAVIRKAEPAPVSEPTVSAAGHSAAIILFSNDLDKAMAALIIACGMAASGAKVGIFFTFWGLSVLRKNPAPAVRKTFLSRMFGRMLPKGPDKLKLSQMHLGGLGSAMMKQAMANHHVASLPELIHQARELGVRFIACEMAMDVMGLTREELIPIDEVAGVASFVKRAKESNHTMFI
ncbi:MAG: FAD-dependent oxidoreductase [Planctomycetia bacterium]|nr:FAD-dependent oxidoreductase [Planctomycetia bacterium]